MFQRIAIAALMLQTATGLAGEKEIAAAIGTIRAVGKEGQGNAAAAASWKSLAAEGQPALLPTLAGFKNANAFSANWLRSAVDAIVEAEAKAGHTLSADAIRGFFLDPTQSPDARRIAFELFEKLQPEAAKELIGQLIDDPSLELRRDAIARRIEIAKDDAAALKPLFAAARDRDQVEEIAKKLSATPEEVIQHFNYITRWHIIGPFDGPNASGFSTKYEPENGVDLKAIYTGQGGAKLAWKPVAAKDLKSKFLAESQLVDLNAEIGKHKDAVAYAYAVIELGKDTDVELRGASQNAVKFFVNGKPVFEREAYHQGTTFDQHVGKCTLKAGRNEILYKICQNDQQDAWAQVWAFQMRICDSTGGPVAMKLVSPTAAEAK